MVISIQRALFNIDSYAVFMLDCFCHSSTVDVPVCIPHAEESAIYFVYVLYIDAVLV